MSAWKPKSKRTVFNKLNDKSNTERSKSKSQRAAHSKKPTSPVGKSNR